MGARGHAARRWSRRAMLAAAVAIAATGTPVTAAAADGGGTDGPARTAPAAGAGPGATAGTASNTGKGRAPAPQSAPAPGGAGSSEAARVTGPLSADEILRRYDLDGDGTIDDIESAIGQAKLRRHRKAVREANDIDPLTGHPRSQSDATTRSGRRADRPARADDGLPGVPGRDLLGGGLQRGGDPPAAPAPAGDDRRERILSILTDPRRPSGAGSSAPRVPPTAAGQERAPQGGGRAEPFGWVPGGNGTLFRGGSYPLPDRGSRSSASSAGKGSGPLLQRGATGAVPGRGSSANSSRALVPPSNRATGTGASGSRGTGGRTGGPSSSAPSGR